MLSFGLFRGGSSHNFYRNFLGSLSSIFYRNFLGSKRVGGSLSELPVLSNPESLVIFVRVIRTCYPYARTLTKAVADGGKDIAYDENDKEYPDGGKCDTVMRGEEPDKIMHGVYPVSWRYVR